MDTKNKECTAIIFDIDDTLYLRAEPYLRTYREFFETDPGLDEAEIIRANYYHKERLFEEWSDGKITLEEMMIRRTVRTFQEFGVHLSDEQALRFEQQYTGNQGHITLNGAFGKLLEELSRTDCVLGVLTNGPSDRQRRKLESLGVLRYFSEDYILVSGDIGIAKPDPGIFRAYEEKTGLAPASLWMVGDNYESDIAGAGKAGWHTIWLNRKGEGVTGEVTPDFQAGTEEEVCRWIATVIIETQEMHLKF